MSIQKLTRQMIIDELLMIDCVTGQMGVAEFVRKVYPKANSLPTTDHRFGMTTAIDDIRQHMERNDDWSFEELFYSYLDFSKIDDEDFKYFLAQYVHPSIRRFQINDELEKIPFSNDVCVEAINKYLTSDGLELKQTSTVANMPIYSVVPLNPGVNGQLKNIIFASKYKPEIVLSDALNNDVTIVNNADKCLVYDEPIGKHGITWKELQDWYDNGLYMLDTGTDMVTFMGNSLGDSPMEQLFFNTYLELAAEKDGKLPALFPQVWLYYDPKLQKDRIKKIFEHQRMDFLMLFSESQRVVIEIDGVQHYADYVAGNKKHYASVDKYADMMAAQREMSLAGYDVYRFGAKELYDPAIGKRKVRAFFEGLFSKYGILA